jgi:hypothetical protein
VWLVVAKGRRGDDRDSDAFLHAYEAVDVSSELYSAAFGPSVRFAMPTVVGGRAYIGEKGVVYVYGARDSTAR